MEGTRGALIVACALLAGVSAAVCLPILLEGCIRRAREARLRTRLPGGGDEPSEGRGLGGMLRRFARVSSGFASGRLAHALEATPLGAPFGRLSFLLAHAGVAMSPAQVLVLMLAACLAAGALLSLLSGSLSVGAILGVLSPVVIFSWASREQQRRHRELRDQLPGALRSISMSVGAGRSLPQSFAYAGEHASGAMAAELVQVVYDVEAGRSLVEAVGLLGQRTDIDELVFVTAALSIQHRTGGSLKDILDSAARSVRDELDLERALQVQTAQARFSSRVVCAMPLLLLCALTLISPGYLQSFFQSVAGTVIFALAIVLDIAGLLAIRRVLGTEVGA